MSEITMKVELLTVPSRDQILVNTRLPYGKVIGVRTELGSVTSRNPTLDVVTHHVYELPYEAAAALQSFYAYYVRPGDSVTQETSSGPEYLCHTLPLYLRGERDHDASSATRCVHELSADYVPLPSGVAVPAGTHGIVRSAHQEGQEPILQHSFVGLGGYACIQVVNYNGNLGVTPYDDVRAEYTGVGEPAELAVPAEALAV